MSVASDLLPLLALFLLRKGGASSPTPAAPLLPPSTPSFGPSSEVKRTLTGGQPLGQWFGERFALALEVLHSIGVPDVALRPVALAVVSQWAHETGRGKSEFNFNLGGWRARKSDPFFTARDVLTPGQPTFKWTAYPDLPFAVTDQLRRLSERFPSAWKLLLSQPHTSAWVEELGRRGYYTAPIPGYVSAWASNRAELERLAP